MPENVMKKEIQHYTVNVSSAQPWQMEIPKATFFRLLDADSAVSVSFDNKKSFGLDLGASISNDFERIRLSSSADQTIKFVIGTNGARYDTNKFNIGSMSFDVSESVPAGLPGTPDVTVAEAAQTLLKVANSDRKTIILQSHPDNTVGEILRVGDSSTNAGTGVCLEPGQICTFEYKGAVYGYSGVAGQKVCVMEVTL